MPSTRESTRPRPGRNASITARSSAGAALALALVLTATACGDSDSNENADGDRPATGAPNDTATATSGSDGSSDAMAIVNAFLAAIEDRDATAAGRYVSVGAPIAIAPVAPGEALDRGMTLAGQIAWNDAWDIRREITACRESEPATSPAEHVETLNPDTGETTVVRYDHIVTCDYTSRHRLGDVTDQVSGTRDATFRLLGDQIVYAAANPQLLNWAELFGPYLEWAATEHPERWAQAWDDSGPLLTEDAAAMDDQLLTEFIELRGNE